MYFLKDAIKAFNMEMINRFGTYRRYIEQWARKRGFEGLKEYNKWRLKAYHGCDTEYEYSQKVAKEEGFDSRWHKYKVNTVERKYGRVVNFLNKRAKKRDVVVITLARLDSRYPFVKKEFPDAKYLSFSGSKFKSLKEARSYYKKQTWYRRRVNKPEIKFEIA